MRIILVGKAASGKDYLRKFLEEKRGMKFAVSYTTRPARVGEVDGVDYNFISEETANHMIENNEFYEYVRFNGWLYGTAINQITDGIFNLFIMTPSGISKLKKEDRDSSIIIYLDIPKDIRINRLSSRNMPGDTLTRRLEADELDFKDFTDYDLKITEQTYTL
jgi:guanylate kinase